MVSHKAANVTSSRIIFSLFHPQPQPLHPRSKNHKKGGQKREKKRKAEEQKNNNTTTKKKKKRKNAEEVHSKGKAGQEETRWCRGTAGDQLSCRWASRKTCVLLQVTNKNKASTLFIKAMYFISPPTNNNDR